MKKRAFLASSLLLMIFSVPTAGCMLLECFEYGPSPIYKADWEDPIDPYLPMGRHSFISNILIVDGGILVMGADIDMVDGERQAASYAAMMSLSGELRWERTYLSGEDSELYDGIEIEEGIYLLAGSAKRQDEDITFFLCLDGDGEVLWERELPYEGDRIYRILSMDGDCAYALGCSTGKEGYDGLLMKIDPAGNVIWRRTYDDGASEFFTDGVLSLDGGIVLMGTRRWMEFFPGRIPLYSQMYVVSVDAEGEERWVSTYGDEKDYTVALGINASREGDYAITGLVSLGREREDVLFSILGGDGNIRSMGTYAGLYDNDDAGYCAIQMPDGRYMVIGISWDWIEHPVGNAWPISNTFYMVLGWHGSRMGLVDMGRYGLPLDPAMPYAVASDDEGNVYMAASAIGYKIYRISFEGNDPIIQELADCRFP